MIISVNDAQDYFDTILQTDAWDYAIGSDRTKALIGATRILESLNFKKELSEYTEYPEWLQFAACEIALALLDGRGVEQMIESAGVAQSGYQNARINVKSVPEYILAGVPSAAAWRYIKPYLHDSKAIKISRG
jgi:hypothetical protein